MIQQQKPADKNWMDETGAKIPYSRTTPYERLLEKNAHCLYREALKVNQQLEAFKEKVQDLCQEAYEASLKETNTEGKARKGNYTWYNFARTIKIEVNVNEKIEFDELLIAACKEKLDEFITVNTGSIDDFMRTLIMDAFEQSGGQLDTRKVLSLRKHKERTSDKLFLEALDLLDKSIRRPSSKTYFRIFVKEEGDKWQNIDLNFSSI
jgi:hypothetical protein